ncbi:MAG: LysR family transcriptional regulator [Aquirhabdus sp.]
MGMNKFHLISVFEAVASSESFSAGARKIGISPPAATRAVNALEVQLGVKLFIRTTRFVRLTDAGARYLESVQRIMADMEEADAVAVGLNAEPHGHLVVTASVLFGSMFVMPSIAAYLKRYPQMSVSALFIDRIVNLFEEEVDVGIRVGELADSNMNAVLVGHVRRILCASPAYLNQYGTPKQPLDLVNHHIISSKTEVNITDWQFSGQSKNLNLKVTPRLRAMNNDVAIQAALYDLGIVRVMSYQVAEHIAAGKLQVVLSDFEMPSLPVNVLYVNGRQASAKVRSFVDEVVTSLRADERLAH